MRKELHDYLKTLRPQAFRAGGVVSIKGPTWCISPKVSIEDLDEEFAADEAKALGDFA